MKSYAFILTLLLTTPALAQWPNPEWPRTVPSTDAMGNINGSATVSGNRVYLRDRNGKHIATMVIAPDGSRTVYNPSGKLIETQKP
jgi:hypothetical protein